MKVKAADASAVKQTHTVSLEGHQILIVRTGKGFLALEDSCPHAQQPLSSGKIDDTVLTCRHHGVRIDLRTGQVIEAMGFLGLQPVAVFPVQETDGSIWVDLPTNRQTGDGGLFRRS